MRALGEWNPTTSVTYRWQFVFMRSTSRQTDRQKDSSPLIVSQKWVPGPSDTSSCLDIRPWGHTAGDGTKLAPSLCIHTHTHSVAYELPYISPVGDTFSFSCVTSSPWSHEGCNSSCQEHTEEHLYIWMGVWLYMCVCVCVHVVVTLVRAKQVSSDNTLSSLWKWPLSKNTCNKSV